VAKKATKRRRKAKPEEEEEEEPADDASPPVAASIPPISDKDMGGSADRGHERIAAWSDQLGRRWGKSTALPFSIAPLGAGFKFIPSGCFLFDWLSGGGLAVVGKTTRAWGPPDSYKTTTLLRTLANAQRTCRYCRSPLVVVPATGRKDCSCPNPRWWLQDEADYIWLPHADAIRVSGGALPPTAKQKTIKGVGKVYVVECAPPPHLAGQRGVPKKRDIVFVEDYRNEPMRAAYCETECKITTAWAVANGVDPASVLLVGGQWAEQTLETVEDVAVTRDFDIVFLDSTSMLDTKSELEKSIGAVRKVGAKAVVMTRFIQRWTAAAGEQGLTGRLRPTLVTTSQVRMAGIGGGGHVHLSPTDGNAFQHGLVLDVKMSSAGFQFRQGASVAHAGKFRFDVRKNHAGGPPRAKGVFQAWLEMGNPDRPVGDVGDQEMCLAYARQFGSGYVLEGTGKAKLTLFSPFLDGGMIGFSAVGDCSRFLRDNPGIYDDLRARTLTKCRAECAPPKIAGDD